MNHSNRNRLKGKGAGLAAALSALFCLLLPAVPAAAEGLDVDSLYEQHREQYEHRDSLEEELHQAHARRTRLRGEIREINLRLGRIRSGEERFSSAAEQNRVVDGLLLSRRKAQAEIPRIVQTEVGIKRELERPEYKVIIACPYNPLWDLLDAECAAVIAKIGMGAGTEPGTGQPARIANPAESENDWNTLDSGARADAPGRGTAGGSNAGGAF